MKQPISIYCEERKFKVFFEDIFEEDVHGFYSVENNFPMSYFPTPERIGEVLATQDKFIVLGDYTYVIQREPLL